MTRATFEPVFFESVIACRYTRTPLCPGTLRHLRLLLNRVRGHLMQKGGLFFVAFVLLSPQRGSFQGL